MKKSFLILMIIVFLMTGTVLFAQSPDRSLPPKPPQMAQPGLTDEQTSKIDALRLKLEKEIIPLQSQLPAIEAALKQELVANSFNQTKVKNLIDQKVKLLSEIELKQFLHQRSIRDLLTPEQQQKFDLQALREGMGPHQKAPMSKCGHGRGAELPPPGSEK